MAEKGGTPHQPGGAATPAPDLTKFFEAVRKFANEFPRKTHNSLRTGDNGKTIGTYVEPPVPEEEE